jgi:hypothetical protein
MATIRRRASSWQAIVKRRGRDPIVQTFRRKADAEDWASQIESEIVRGVYRERSQDEQLSLGPLIDWYLVEVTPFKKGPKPKPPGCGLCEAIRCATSV